jgi:hypothetical protein
LEAPAHQGKLSVDSLYLLGNRYKVEAELEVDLDGYYPPTPLAYAAYSEGVQRGTLLVRFTHPESGKAVEVIAAIWREDRETRHEQRFLAAQGTSELPPFYPCCETLRKRRLGEDVHAAGFLSGVRPSRTKNRIMIPTMYVALSTVNAVEKPALSMRYPVTSTQNGWEMKPNRKYVLKAASRSSSVVESAMMACVWGPRDEVKAL